MKTFNQAMDVKGLKTPDFNEPKSEKYYEVLTEAKAKVNTIFLKRNGAKAEANKLKAKLTHVRTAIAIEEDEFEKISLLNQKKELEEAIDLIADHSEIDVAAYAENVANDSKLLALKVDAEREYAVKYKEVKEYRDKLQADYKKSIREVNRFLSGLGSDSTYLRARSIKDTILRQE